MTSRDLAPRLVKRAPVAPPPVKPAPTFAPPVEPVARKAYVESLQRHDLWLGELHPVQVQRPSQPCLAVGRLRRLDGSRGVLIHVVALDAETLEVRHRLTEPDGPYVVVGTLLDGAGLLDLNADTTPPMHVQALIEPRRRHAGWNVFRRQP